MHVFMGRVYDLNFNMSAACAFTRAFAKEDRPVVSVLGALLTRPCSLQRVSMTSVWTFFSQIILQKHLTVAGKGPWAAINSLLEL